MSRPSWRLARVAILVLAALAPQAVRSSEAVILLHGLARSSRSMLPMRHALERAGYDVFNLSYPTTEATVAALAEQNLAPLVATCQAAQPDRIHFVAHSLGGIVIRQYLSQHSITNLGRIVMLGTPNQGSEVVDHLGQLTLFEWINGPAGLELGTGTNATPSRLPVPAADIGVIAGTRSINLILSTMIPGPDDGKVSTASARLSDMKDYAEVPTAHPFLMRDPKVIAMTLSFLKSGAFTNAPAAAP